MATRRPKAKLKLDLAAARAELERPLHEIEAETAYKWAARAIVAYEAFAKTRGSGRLGVCTAASVRYLMRGSACEHEALEHAGDGEVLEPVRAAILRVRQKLKINVEC